jgi:hypothetical protein
MSRRASFTTASAILRRIKEGRGQGEGKGFKPWHRVKDVPSKGRRHLIYIPKFDRIMHFMSDLERNAGFASECIKQVIGNREQLAHLPLARTQQIARELKYRHPRPGGGHHDVVMATDQVWTLEIDAGNALQPLFVKYRDELKKERVQEKREIEKLSWARMESTIPILPLADFSEYSVSEDFVINWDLIRHTLRPDYFKYFPPGITESVNDCAYDLAAKGDATLDEISEFTASKLRQSQAQVLTAIHYLLASMSWPVDLETTRLSPTAPLKFFKNPNDATNPCRAIL